VIVVELDLKDFTPLQRIIVLINDVFIGFFL